MTETTKLTTTAGAPVADNQNSQSRRPARSAAAAGLPAPRKARAPEPRAHSRTLPCTPRAGAPTARSPSPTISRSTPRPRLFSEVGKKTDMLAPLLDGRRRAWRGRRRARRARLRSEVLHRGRQLGPRRQQHAGVLRPRPAEIPGLHPYPEAAPEDQHALADGDVGFLVAVARKACTRSRS